MSLRIVAISFVLMSIFSTVSARTITDSLGRTVSIPETVEDVICSGSGCLRLLVYLQAQDRVIAVDDLELRQRKFDARPYAIGNPQFSNMPIFGEFRGRDNPELILSLTPQPQVIFKTFASSIGYDPDELQKKTGIPVVALDYGNLTHRRSEFFLSLMLMGDVLHRKERANEVVLFFKEKIADLEKRSIQPSGKIKPTVYLGGVAFKGAHGLQSTERDYPPFTYLHATNMFSSNTKSHTRNSTIKIAKEKLLLFDPDLLFIDLSTMQLGDRASGLSEISKDPAYQTLKAVKAKLVYGLLPYNWYTHNYGSILANGYFIGKILYPQQFIDIDATIMADEIYTFLVGKPVFDTLNNRFHNLVFSPILR